MIASNAHDHAHRREIARALAAAVTAAVDAARGPEGSSRTLPWGAAAGVAELLELHGLMALLNACEAHVEAPPRAVANVLDRLARLAAETESHADLAPFIEADHELAALAGVLGAQDWAAPSDQEPTPEPVQSLAELLADFPLDDAGAIARARVTLPVAAGVRAALDWLGAEQGGPLHVTVHDAALSLGVRVTHEPGLAPAGAVLALMSGALLPEPDGRWVLRVPLHTARPAFLLARQGALLLALPWHAVARLQIANDAARAAMIEPTLEPWATLTRAQGERPVALLAHGLSRAWLQLDHIVWRVFTHPEPGVAPAVLPTRGLRVSTEEGAEYWVVDAEAALAAVPQLHTPPPRLRPRGAAPEQKSAAAPAPVATMPAPVAEPAPVASAPAPVAPPAPRELTPEDVRPLARPHVSAPAPTPALEPTPARFEVDPRDALPQAPAELAPHDARPLALSAPGVRSRRALIVDDSLVTRMALARVLEREGWLVEGAERAAEMWDALRTGEWTAVFVDVSLPDASGRAHLRTLVAQQLSARRRFELVALTRDSAERRLAEEAGITRTMRKPFAPRALESLVRELPAASAGA